MRFELGVTLGTRWGKERHCKYHGLRKSESTYEMKGPASIYMKPTSVRFINSTLGNFLRMDEYPVQQPKKSRE